MAEGRIWTPGGERPVGGEPQSEPERVEISPEELAELMRQLKISDFLLSNLTTLTQLAFAKLDRSSRDLEQARLAIDALRALLPVLEGSAPEQALRDFAQAVSSLQIAYTRAADEESRGGEGEREGETEPPEEAGGEG